MAMPEHRNPEDGALEHLQVLRAQLGDRVAYERLFERHHAPVLRYVHGLLSNGADAEDVMQDVWVTIVRKIATLEHPAAFQRWMYRIARNRCVSRLRRSRRQVALEDLDDTEQLKISADLDDDNDPSLSSQDAAALDAGLARLSSVHREVLTLRFMNGLTYEEIAAVTACSIGTVRSRIYYGKQSLRTHISPEEDRP
ncbi:MAG: sigma-70 family RNA polymerase sigma factor [Gemmatimonadetes bacterium]|nr:sigma-70 family RNA polymerase sigma factor [Gemmatimonadota bacterium]